MAIKKINWKYSVTVHGALHLAARHPAGKIAVACIQPLAVRRLFNGLDTVTGAPKGCEPMSFT